MVHKYEVYCGVPDDRDAFEAYNLERSTEIALPGFTKVLTTGGWKGKVEKSVKYEIIVDSETDERAVLHFAMALKRLFNQKEVLIIKYEIQEITV